MKQNKPNNHLIGIGLDNTDGHTRITRGPNFYLQGGSKDTHTHLQETAIKINEHLDSKGKQLQDTTPQEFRDILDKVTDSIGKPPGEPE